MTAQRGVEEGGYAYLMSRVDKIRTQDPDTMLFMADDTLQGGVEVLYTAGQSALRPGPVHGGLRYRRWGIVAANAYFAEGFDNSATRQRAGRAVSHLRA